MQTQTQTNGIHRKIQKCIKYRKYYRLPQFSPSTWKEKTGFHTLHTCRHARHHAGTNGSHRNCYNSRTHLSIRTRSIPGRSRSPPGSTSTPEDGDDDENNDNDHNDNGSDSTSRKALILTVAVDADLPRRAIAVLHTPMFRFGLRLSRHFEMVE